MPEVCGRSREKQSVNEIDWSTRQHPKKHADMTDDDLEQAATAGVTTQLRFAAL
jgi:hypothetical protein